MTLEHPHPHAGSAARVVAETSMPPAAALRRIAALPLPAMFTSWSVFPAVVDVEGQVGPWERVGGSRTVRLADGGTLLETLVSRRAGRAFAYDLTAITGVFGLLVRRIDGEWTARREHGTTVISWSWTFTAQPFRGVLVRRVLVPLWRRNMQRMLAATLPGLERADALGVAA